MEKRDVPTDEEVAARVGERLTNLLEDRIRERTNLDRERLQRFLPVVTELVEEGEPELLAMLLDEAYQRAPQGPRSARPWTARRASTTCSSARPAKSGRAGAPRGRRRRRETTPRTGGR